MNQQTRLPKMKRPRLYQSFLVALVPTLLLSLVQVSRLTRLPAYHDSAASHIPLASSRSSISHNKVETKKDSLVDEVEHVESNVMAEQQQSDGRRLAVVSFVDSMDYYLWGIYSIHKQLKKVGMTPHIRHVALVASDMKSKHLHLIESWLGKENVWPINKSILRKKVPKGNKLWGAVFSKLEFFNLTMFDKVIALDNDILIRRNIEHWFDLPAPAATQERGSIEWNSGAMVSQHHEFSRRATMSAMMSKRPPTALTASMPLSKRPKVAVNISEDVLGIVMEFLSPKQLYRIALTCKALRAAVTTRCVSRKSCFFVFKMIIF